MELKKSFQYSVLFLAITSPVAMAQNYKAEVVPSYFNGFFAGIGVGAGTMMTKTTSETWMSSSYEEPFFPSGFVTEGYVSTNNAMNHVYRYGVIGDVIAGYSTVLQNNIYLGAQLGVNFFGPDNTEMFANNSTAQSATLDGVVLEEQKSLSSNTTVTRNSVEPFLDLKLGILINPTTLAYLKGGINYNQLDINTTGTINTSGTVSSIPPEPCEDPICAPASYVTTIKNSDSDSGIGYRAGLGLEVMLTSNLSFAIDYTYTFYPSVSTGTVLGNGGDSVCSFTTEGLCNNISAQTASASEADINDQQVMAQLIYHFS